MKSKCLKERGFSGFSQLNQKEKLAEEILKVKDGEAALKAQEGKAKIELNKAKYQIKTLEANKER